MRQTGFHSDLTAVLVLTAGQWLWWLDTDISIVLKIVPSMLLLFETSVRHSSFICVWLVCILLEHTASKFDGTRFLKIFQFALKTAEKHWSVLALSRVFLHYTDPGWAPHIYIPILSAWGKTSKSALRSMYNKRTASTPTVLFPGLLFNCDKVVTSFCFHNNRYWVSIT